MGALIRIASPPGDADEPATFEAIYRAHAPSVFALLTRLVGPDRDREDLLQETFLRLHPALTRFRGDCSLRTFIFQIATRTAIDHLRKRRRTPSLDVYDLDDAVDPRATPAEQAQRREELARALELLAQLKPKHRVAFVLREVMDLPFDEVAQIVDSNAAATRMRVNAAKRALAKLGGRS